MINFDVHSQTLAFFQGLSEIIEKEELPPANISNSGIKPQIAHQSKPLIINESIKSAQVPFQPKEIIYGLSSKDWSRRWTAFQQTSKILLDPQIHLAVDFEEIMLVLLNLNLEEMTQNCLETTIAETQVTHLKNLSALFIYNPRLLLKLSN